MAENRSKSARKGKARQRKTDYPLPYPEFPLSPHVHTKRWYKTHKGRRYYFGPLDDWETALEQYEREWPQILAGRKPRPDADERSGLTLATGVNLWLNARVEDGESGAIKPSTLRNYREMAQRLVNELGRGTLISWLGPDDFRKLGKRFRNTLPPVRAKMAFAITRQIFHWLFQNEHIPAPPRYGTDFKQPHGEASRGQRRSGQTYSAEQVRMLLEAAQNGVEGKQWKKGQNNPAGVRPSQVLRCMILLGINGGFTQAELAELRLDDVELEDGIIDYQRGKTGARRTVPLWPETVAALKLVREERPDPQPEAKELLFVTRQGFAWVREWTTKQSDPNNGNKVELKHHRVDSIRLQFDKLRRACGIDMKQTGFGHLRHTHRTVTDEVADPHAAMRIMGHDVPGISKHYVRDISLERLRAVTDHVRSWLGFDTADDTDDKNA